MKLKWRCQKNRCCAARVCVQFGAVKWSGPDGMWIRVVMKDVGKKCLGIYRCEMLVWLVIWRLNVVCTSSLR